MPNYARLPETDVTLTGGATEAKQDTIIANQVLVLAELQKDVVELLRHEHATNSIPDSAADYQELVASSAADYESISFFNSTGILLVLAVGADTAEVNKIFLPPGGSSNTQPVRIPSGSRISVATLTGSSTTTGEINITCYG